MPWFYLIRRNGLEDLVLIQHEEREEPEWHEEREEREEHEDCPSA